MRRRCMDIHPVEPCIAVARSVLLKCNAKIWLIASCFRGTATRAGRGAAVAPSNGVSPPQLQTNRRAVPE